MRIVLILWLLVISATATATDYVGRLAADDKKGGDPSLLGQDALVSDQEPTDASDSAPVANPAGEASESRSTLPDETAPLPLFNPADAVHTIEVGLLMGTATHIGGGWFIGCSHLWENNPVKNPPIKIDGKQYGGRSWKLYDADLSLIQLDFFPESPSVKAMIRPLVLGEPLTLIGKMTGTIKGTVTDQIFDDHSLFISTPEKGVVPGDSGGAAIDIDGYLVAVVIGDHIEGDNVQVTPLTLEKNRFQKLDQILQGSIPPPPTEEQVLDKSHYEYLLFTATWCGPCRIVKSTILHKIEGAGYKVTPVDTDSKRDMAVEYDIMSIPTWVLLKDGIEIHRESYGNVDTLLKAAK